MTDTKYGLSEPTAPEFGPDCPNILAWADGKSKGAKHERALIVAWLRETAHTGWVAEHAYPSFSVEGRDGKKHECVTPIDADELATAIENRAHLEQ